MTESQIGEERYVSADKTSANISLSCHCRRLKFCMFFFGWTQKKKIPGWSQIGVKTDADGKTREEQIFLYLATVDAGVV